MKSFNYIVLMGIFIFSGCSSVTPRPDTHTNNKLVKVDTSTLGLENTKSQKEVHVTYDAHDEQAQKYQQLQEIEEVKKEK